MMVESNVAVHQPSLVPDQLLQRLAEARAKSDALFNIVRPESLYDRPIAERHRIVFYIGHLEAFDWNLLRERLLPEPGFHPAFDRLFAFGIDPVGGNMPSDRPSDWPRLEEVYSYRDRVRATLDRSLARAFRDFRQDQGETAGLLLNVVIEHRLMHLETLAYMFHRLPFEAKLKQSSSVQLATSKPVHRMIEVPAGMTTLGLSRAAGTFGWDNEFEAYETVVPAFEIDQFMVTNRQYLQFLESGGYEARALWSDADWQWKSSAGISHPAFWTRKDNAWFWRSMFEDIPLPLDGPVYVSHAEASAFAKWAGKSLPTEEEWHRVVYAEGQTLYPWGDEPPSSRHAIADFESWDPVPVNALPDGASAFGLQGALGNGWEWTSTLFAPFPGFQPFPFYPGYSADFFDGRHYVMKGGSPRTAGCMLRASFRNWFQPHYPYVYAGFRCVIR